MVPWTSHFTPCTTGLLPKVTLFRGPARNPHYPLERGRPYPLGRGPPSHFLPRFRSPATPSQDRPDPSSAPPFRGCSEPSPAPRSTVMGTREPRASFRTSRTTPAMAASWASENRLQPSRAPYPQWMPSWWKTQWWKEKEKERTRLRSRGRLTLSDPCHLELSVRARGTHFLCACAENPGRAHWSLAPCLSYGPALAG